MNKLNNDIYYNNGVFRVAIDCDDTILKFGEKIWDVHNKKFDDNVDYRLANKWGFHFHTKPSVTFEDTMETLYTRDLFLYLELIPGAKELIEAIHNEKFSYYLVTDVPKPRPDINPRQDRIENIKELFPEFDLEKIIFTSEKNKTGRGFVTLVDDKPDTYHTFIKEERNIILMDAPHNRDIKNVYYRAKDPMDAFPMIMDIREKELKKMRI